MLFVIIRRFLNKYNMVIDATIGFLAHVGYCYCPKQELHDKGTGVARSYTGCSIMKGQNYLLLSWARKQHVS